MKEVKELRRHVEEQERKELRQDLASALQAGIGTDELGEALRQLIRQSLEEVVHEALEGERVRKVIEHHVTDRILTGVAGELRDAQQELLAKTRDDLVRTWREASSILLGSLRKEMTESARQAIRVGFRDVSFRKEMLLALREAQEEDRPAALPTTPVREPRPSGIAERVESPKHAWEGPPVMMTYKPRWPLRSLSSWRPWLLGAGVLILVGLAVLLWLLAPQPTRRSTTGPTPALEPPPKPPDSLREIWMERMSSQKAYFRPYYGLTEVLSRHSFSDQFDCWFDADARLRLDYLRKTPNSGELGVLREAFASCVQESYTGSPGNRLPILGAQVIVLELLRQHANGTGFCGDWRPNLPNPESFFDGESGRRTEELLNGYLIHCTKSPSLLRIDSESTTPEYLFVLYSGLKDLEASR